ncbi:ribose-phosphate diphosphokinase [Rhodoferax sp. PAMC 29310]|uniref:ribose-phosphate diphosphokinase n=1 Tax=Rhodoferax sp. PAMC 29310 TaxID=2822760 RepID=UPI001B33DC90|nr:ribose-phosphate diphosphokinase [Rhodoferax sp. PAMC 29310]
MTRDLLLCFSDETDLGERISRASGFDLAKVERHQFPDGETKLRVPDAMPRRVVILRSLNQPNDKLIELLLAAKTARLLGAHHLTLVAPYLAYMRQDIAFQPGEAISQRIIGKFLAELFDTVITIDPHLHRVKTLQEAIPAAKAVVLSAAPLLADFVATHRTNPVLIGPDEESAPWIALAAARHGFEHAVCKKVRHGDHNVAVSLPPITVTGRPVVLLDDIASTGQTVAQTARLLLSAGAASVDVAVTHALFAGNAMQVLRDADIQNIWSTDCVYHSSNAVSVAPLISQTLAALATA